MNKYKVIDRLKYKHTITADFIETNALSGVSFFILNPIKYNMPLLVAFLHQPQLVKLLRVSKDIVGDE
jgi:hypothetical protein